MSEEKKKNQSNPGLAELLEKYKDSSVVTEIEKNIQISSSSEISVADLALFPLFDETNYNLNEGGLYDSMKMNGIMFPLFVRPNEGKYEVVNGVKRFLIAKSVGMKSVPVVIINFPIEEIIAYILNNEIKNGDNAFVRGTAYRLLITNFKYTEKDIRLMTGISHGQVNNLMRILNLPKEVKTAVVKERLSYAEARVLLGLAKTEQIELMDRIIKEKLSVREAERLAGSYKKTSYMHDTKAKMTRNGQTITIRLSSPEDADELEKIIQSYLNKTEEK